MLKRFWMGLITVLCAIAITITFNYAWFVNGYDVDPLATGSSVDAYYHSGTGTKDDPYVITTARHLYNFAWLQYMGRYNKDKKSGTSFPCTYFRLGTKGTTGGNIDMTGWYLPPIGTAKYPFIGNFNGQGWTINNLISTNRFGEFGNRHPSGVTSDNFEADNCGTIGFFGAIGAYNQSVISDTDTLNGCTYETENNQAYNFYLNNTNVHTGTSATIIGAVAGYVNATLSQVGVIQPHLNIDTTSSSAKLGTNFSDFAVVGYAEEKYTTQKTKSSTIIYNPTYEYSHFNFNGMGNQAAWGGSIAMRDLNLRNKDFYGYATNGSSITYTDKEFKVVNGNNISRTSLSNTTSGNDDKGFKYIKAEDYKPNLGAESGSYLLVHEKGWTHSFTYNTSAREAYSYSFLTAVYKKVIELTISDEKKSGFKIKSGSVFLNRDGSDITAENGETVWRMDNSNHIYTYVDNLDVYGNDFNNSSTTNQYYLNATTTTLSLGTTATTSWSWDSTHNTYVFTSGNNNYGIIYNGDWKVECVDLYKIHDGNGNYLSIDNNRNIMNSNDNNAIAWVFSSPSTNPSGTISTVINGTTYYLHYNNGLTLSTNSTNWSNAGAGLYYNGNYIQYRQIDNGVYKWIASSDKNNYSVCYITDNNGNYLSIDTSGNIINETSANSATQWVFTNHGTNPSGYIFTTINNTTYYLSYNNGLTTTTNQTTSWSNAGSGVYYSGNYVQFRDGKWIASTDTTTTTRYRITDGNGNYLSINGTSIVNETSESDAIGWTFSDTTSTYPSGTISTIINGTTYYLRDNNSLELSTTLTTWSNVGSGIYSGTNYIRYTGEIWTSTSSTSETRYYISSGSNYLSVSGTSLTNVTQQANATKWVFSNYNGTGTISTKINEKNYYLHLNGSTLELSNTSTNWTNNNNRLNNGYYYIQYTNSSWIASNQYWYISSGSNYLSVSGTSLTNVTQQANATLWNFSNGGQYPGGVISNASSMSNHLYIYRTYNWDNWRYTYTLRYGGTSQSWTNSNNNVLKNSNYANYCIQYNSGWSAATSSTPLTFTAPSVTLTSTTLNYSNSHVSNGYTSSYVRSYVSNIYDSLYNPTIINTYIKNFGISKVESEMIDGVNTNITTNPVSRAVIKEPSEFSYIPLNVDDNYKVKDTNTGYFVGGGHESQYQEDVRFAAYPASDISSSYSYDDKSFSTIYTVNDSNNPVPIDDSNPGFVKYAESRSTFLDTLNKSNNRVYGVHFMNAPITKDTVITAPKVLFNDNQQEKIKYNFEMPEDSIDFYLKTKGYINFFAGYYFSSQDEGANSSFFALHQIERDKYNRIIAFNHITGVYQKDKTSPYVYSLDGATHNYSSVDSKGNIVYYDNLLSGYSLVFNSNWIEHPCMEDSKDNNLYYFEVPVNAGEFALGSVDGEIGAYLLYLDIGANAAPVDRTRILQETSTTKEGLKYVNGIQILSSSTYISDANSAVATISTSTKGTINISRSTDTISFTNDSDQALSLSSTYKGEGITISGASWSPISSAITTSKVLRFVDYNRSTEKLYYTTIYNNGTENTSYDCYRIDPSTGDKINLETNEWGILVISNGSGTSTTLPSFDNIATTSGYTFGTTKILDYYSYIEKANLSSLTEVIDMTVSPDSTVVPQADGSYAYEHSYHLAGNAITLTPNDLLVYVGPNLKASASISDPSSNVVTVTTEVNNVTYTFTFNADAKNDAAKTITIYYEAPETP